MLGVGQVTYDSMLGESEGGDLMVRDLAKFARTATERAIDDAGVAFRRRQRVAVQGGERPATVKFAQLAPFLTVGLQVARLPERIMIPIQADRHAIFRCFAPGFHGLRLLGKSNRGGQVEKNSAKNTGKTPGAGAWSWPATALAANFTARQQIVHTLRPLGYGAQRDLHSVGRPGGPRLERFEVIHFVRVRPSQPVERLIRGNVHLPPDGVSEHTLDAMRQRLVRYLLTRQRKDGSFAGIYNPTADRFKTTSATIEDMALAAYALARYSNLNEQVTSATGGLDVSQAVHRVAGYVVNQLIQRSPLPSTPAPTSMALAILTILESKHLADLKGQRDELATRLLAHRDEDGLFHQAVESATPVLEPTQQAIVLSALARLYEQRRDKQMRPIVEKSLARCWQLIEAKPVIGALPWLIDSEFMLRPREDADPLGHQVRIERIRHIIEDRRQYQIVNEPSLGPPDVLGGFDFFRAQLGGAPHADWHSAQGLMLLAVALRYPSLRQGQDLLRWRVDCVLACRFLAQLMFDEPSCYYVRRQRDVIGAIRASLHDNTLSIVPTSLALLALTELQQSLNHLNR